jgi:uncharacterized BrkB/YihY/UPF0761 family membrane protein
MYLVAFVIGVMSVVPLKKQLRNSLTDRPKGDCPTLFLLSGGIVTIFAFTVALFSVLILARSLAFSFPESKAAIKSTMTFTFPVTAAVGCLLVLLWIYAYPPNRKPHGRTASHRY